MRKEKEYYLGLDIGSASVGWAITDANYKVLRANGKDLWGVRLFDSADTAKNRRTFRSNRRRLERRKWRIKLLQEIFAEEINKVDAGFFHRMKESKYHPEDKLDEEGNTPVLPYSLFIDNDFTDKDYHKKFPTIYHLRKYLMETDEKVDIRLIYLALHHIMKYRGHFLIDGDIKEIKDFNTVFDKFLECLNDELEIKFNFDDKDKKEIKDILSDKNLSKKDKGKKLVEKIKCKKDKPKKEILNLITGNNAQLDIIFDNNELNNIRKGKLCFSSKDYDENKLEFETELGENLYIIDLAKAIYDWSVLVEILGDRDCISDAKADLFEKHKNDLKRLKYLVKKFLSKEDYKDLFTNNKENNYVAYIGMGKINAKNSSGKKKYDSIKKCSKEKFYKYLTDNIIKKISDIENEDVVYIRNEIEKQSFLPKQVSVENVVLPHQLHLNELNKIIDNLSEKTAILKEYKEKLNNLFKFRIPYYIGPLNENSKFSWLKRESGKIYPWNFNEKVDIEESAKEFIKRMTNKCTYMIGEDVLPKESLLYSKFVVLNELNNIKINGEDITPELKKDIYRDLFEKHKKVSLSRLKGYLKSEKKCEDPIITGIDKEFKGSLKAYHDFKNILTNTMLSQSDKEDIVMDITLFKGDKKLLYNRLKNKFPKITANQLGKLCNLNYSGWGRLSKKFLEELVIDYEGMDNFNIINALYETNDNLMQLLSKEKYNFAKELEKHNEKFYDDSFDYEYIDKLYVSPSVKRQIWQTLKVIKELNKVMGCPPKRIFIEVAKEKQDSKRTDSRKATLEMLYKNCKEENLGLDSISNEQLRSDKLYLYYLQRGRSMYTGKCITLDKLNSDYDIDHIYPRSKTMDDSLVNKVLVEKYINGKKGDVYPLDREIREQMKPFWNELLQQKFIEKEKYHRLTRGEDFSDKELVGFIQRQLVETRQATKVVGKILEKLYTEADVVYSKAKFTSDFRVTFGMLKNRELNDLHHAKDAYLNIVVGNTYFVKFTKDIYRFIKDNRNNRNYTLSKMFTNKYDIVEKNGKMAWKQGNNGTIVTVKERMKKNSILVSKKIYEEKGEFFNQLLLKKGEGQKVIKESDERLHDINKYGGYNSIKGSYFVLVESKDGEGKKFKTIEYIPIYLKDKIEKSDNEMKKYLEDMGFIAPKILINKIKIGTLFKWNGSYIRLSGRSNDYLWFHNANQLIIGGEVDKNLKKVINFVNKKKENKEYTLSEKWELNNEKLLAIYDTFLKKMYSRIYYDILNKQGKNLKDARDNFINLDIENKCILLENILHFFQCNANTANLKLIKKAERAGTISKNKIINKDIKATDKISIINQSVTGIFETEIDLLKL